MNTTLYQFPISHYCEKVRWALDYKGVPYSKKNLLPGLHMKTTRKLARHSSVPILDHGGTIVQGSSEIISYLDKTLPERLLTPVNPAEAQLVREWERYLDEEVGVHLRRCVYYTLLDYPDIVIGFFAQDGSWWNKPLLKLMFPRVKKLMRARMKIDAAGAAESREHLDAALQRVQAAIADNQPFLVGKQFSRADLTAAALLAPLFMPPQYGLQWPRQMPEPIRELSEQYQPQLEWAAGIYQRYRGG